jgi:hypothetical protein
MMGNTKGRQKWGHLGHPFHLYVNLLGKNIFLKPCFLQRLSSKALLGGKY